MHTTATLGDASRSPLSRVAIFVYGVAAYAIGVGALVAVILFMLGVLHFTGGPIAPLPTGQALALDLLLLIGFALQHSVMARPAFKARWTRIVPVEAERATYVLATGIVLVPVLLLWQPMPALVWSVGTPALRWAITGLALAGWTYLLVASYAIDHFELFGLQQVYRALRGRATTSPPFQERWMYRFDRHPIMTGILLGLWATPTMTLDHLVFSVGFTLYVFAGVHFEERSLRRELGQPYEDYCARVGTIVPTFGGRRVDA